MIKRLLALLFGLVGCSFTLMAQSREMATTLALGPSDLFSAVDSVSLIRALPVLGLLSDARLPVASGLGQWGMLSAAFFPDAESIAAEKAKASPARRNGGKNPAVDGKDLPSEALNSSADPLYYGGEMGILYGHVSGKFGGDLFSTYVVGGVGNDKFQINAGVSYQEWDGKLPRLRQSPAR